MMRESKVRMVLGGVVAVLLVSNAILLTRQCDVADMRRKAKTLDEHCQRMVAALTLDEVEMQGSSLRRDAASRLAKRFEGAGHELRMCTEDVPDRDHVWACVAREDYGCLATIARKMAAAIRAER